MKAVSPEPGATDTMDTLAECAYEGMAVYLDVFLNGERVSSVRRHRLASGAWRALTRGGSDRSTPSR